MAKHRRVKGVLLDFDGTLVDLATDYEGLRVALKEILEPHGIRVADRSLLDGLAVARGRPRSKGVARALAAAYRAVDRFEWAARGEALAIPEGRDLCVALEGSGLPWAVVSNNGPRIIRWCLARFDFPEPAAVLGRGTTRAHKPDPSVGVRALWRIGAAPGDAILVGDSDNDSRLGRALGIETWRVPGRLREARAATFLRIRRRLGLV